MTDSKNNPINPAEFPIVYNFPNCRTTYKNFEGRKNEYNDAGQKTFSIRISEEEALHRFPMGYDAYGEIVYGPGLIDQGLNVKPMPHREDEINPDWHLPVSIRYDPDFPSRNPGVTMISTDTNGRPVHTSLNEFSIGLIDRADVIEYNVAVRIHNWKKNGKSGRKAYLRNMDVTVYQDCVEKRRALLQQDEFGEDDEVEAI